MVQRFEGAAKVDWYIRVPTGSNKHAPLSTILFFSNMQLASVSKGRDIFREQVLRIFKLTEAF